MRVRAFAAPLVMDMRVMVDQGTTRVHVGSAAPPASEGVDARDALIELERLKRERDAVVLAHYYVPAEVQRLADYVGDSYGLAKLATHLPHRTIVLAGVRFMAESVKLLNPDKTVLLPDETADCPMAHMVQRGFIEQVRARYGDDLAVVCYVNSTVEAKALSDVCVTSSNAVRICRRLEAGNILLVPDGNLGRYLAGMLPDKNIIINDGFCPCHQGISAVGVEEARVRFPKAPILAHPECGEGILRIADFVGSTSQIIESAVVGSERDFIIATVEGVSSELELRTAGTGKRFHFPSPIPVCEDMGKITLERVLACLAEGGAGVSIAEEHRGAARCALDRMLQYAAE